MQVGVLMHTGEGASRVGRDSKKYIWMGKPHTKSPWFRVRIEKLIHRLPGLGLG